MIEQINVGYEKLPWKFTIGNVFDQVLRLAIQRVLRWQEMPEGLGSEMAADA